jgi:hypothetical protein
MMRDFRLFLSAAAVCTLTAGVSGIARQQPAPPAASAPDVSKLGPQVGEKVPDFSLPDQRGSRQTLSSLTGPKGLVLVFSRSADW